MSLMSFVINACCVLPAENKTLQGRILDACSEISVKSPQPRMRLQIATETEGPDCSNAALCAITLRHPSFANELRCKFRLKWNDVFESGFYWKGLPVKYMVAQYSGRCKLMHKGQNLNLLLTLGELYFDSPQQALSYVNAYKESKSESRVDAFSSNGQFLCFVFISGASDMCIEVHRLIVSGEVFKIDAADIDRWK